jgi:hypothetical protein
MLNTTLEQKSALARLLATENLRVNYSPNYPTAFLTSLKVTRSAMPSIRLRKASILLSKRMSSMAMPLRPTLML